MSGKQAWGWQALTGIGLKEDPQKEEVTRKTGSPDSSIILFTSAKGGSGCSFLANTIASYMAQETTLNVLLLDMNIGKMDSRLIFGIDDPSARDFGYMAAGDKSIDISHLKKIVINLNNSLNLILPPLQTESISILKSNRFNSFIEALRDHFDIICMDIPGHLLGIIDIKEIDICDRLVLVSLPDIFSVHNTRLLARYVEGFRSAYYFYVVINKYNIKPAISPTGLSNILKYPVASFIPYDRDMENLVNTRGPGHVFRYRLRISQNISGLAAKIYEELMI